MSKLVEENIETSTKYQLFNVIVYSGNGEMGVNIGFIRPNQDSDWYRFDGEVVVPVPESEVFETGFCGYRLNREGFFTPDDGSVEKDFRNIRSAASIYVEPHWASYKAMPPRPVVLSFTTEDVTSLQAANIRRAADMNLRMLALLSESRRSPREAQSGEDSEVSERGTHFRSLSPFPSPSNELLSPLDFPFRPIEPSVFDTSRPWATFATQLVYLREDCIDSLFEPVNIADCAIGIQQALKANAWGLPPIATLFSQG